MLNKLLKYDLKGTYKILIIFYMLGLFFSVLTRIFFSIENSFIMEVIAKICSGVTISMLFNILINNLMRLWVDFKKNLYGDESYLTHTLPVEKHTLYLSKILTAMITLFTSVFVIGITIFIAYYSKGNLELIKSLLLPLATAYKSTIIKIILAFLFIFFLEFINAMQAGYIGIILGHKMNSVKTGYSILFGFVAYIITQIIVLIGVFICALFNSDIMNLFVTNTLVNIDMIKLVIYLAIGMYTLTFIIGYLFNLKMFKKGVNID